MAELIQAIIQLFQLLWGVIYLMLPIKAIIVRKGNLGVRFTFGRPGSNLNPGLHLATMFQTMEDTHTTLCYNVVDKIKITLRDGVPIEVDAVMTYTVEDLGQFLTASENTDFLISEAGEMVLRQVLGTLSFAQFHSKPDDLDKKICTGLQKACRSQGFGAKIKLFRIKSYEVLSLSVRNALAIRASITALSKIPDKLAHDHSFGAMVALVTAAPPANVLTQNFPEDS